MSKQPQQTLDCGACGKATLHERRLDTGAMACIRCRLRVEMPAPAAKPAGGAMPVLLLGAALALVSAFLPWISLGAISRTGFDLGSDATFILVLGAISGLIGLDRRTGTVGRVTAVVLGVIIVGIGGSDYASMRERLAGLNGTMLEGAGSVGAGIYAAMAGGVLIAVGGLFRR